jgi:hypothetical protein
MPTLRHVCLAAALGASLALGACAAAPVPAAAPAAASAASAMVPAAGAPVHRVVFVIVMENHDAGEIVGNTASAPYINTVLIPNYAHATNFVDELPIEIPSEPHYVWMEAGTNRFADHTFTNDQDPDVVNSTASREHLATQIRATNGRVDWRAYQEALDPARTGACPIESHGLYGAKHDPFVFFEDVTGTPPSKTNAYCASHHRNYSALAGDLAAGSVAAYNLITPDLCHDMHGARACAGEDTVRIGDDWLRAQLPPLIAYANAHDGVIFITWDEGEQTLQMPFLAIGPHVKKGYGGALRYTHGSMLKSVERMLQLPVLATVKDENDLADLFVAGQFP